MIRLLSVLALALALAVASPPVAAQVEVKVPELSLEHRMLVRCSAAFALVAQGQVEGDEEALRYPDISARGSEFFVQAGARLMDEASLDRQQLTAVLAAEAQELRNNGTIEDVMPVCLTLLDE